MVCFAATFLMGAADARAQQARRPPNIILILADDMGYSDIGPYGSEIPTPNLDRLAREGTRFSRFYNAGRCVPTRAALMTGLYQHQAGMGHMVEDFGHPSYRGFLNRRSLTIAEALRPAGYQSYAVGKWHLGNRRGHWPLDRGFDRFYGLPGGGGVYFKSSLERRKLQVVLDSSVVTPPAEWYSTDAFTDHAVEFIREAQRSRAPFFLYLAHVAPHFPLQAPEADVEPERLRYRRGWDEVRRDRFQRLKEQRLIPPKSAMSPRDLQVPAWEKTFGKNEWALKMAVYAAMIKRMDHGIGRVLETLDSLGIAENTLVLFLSDNGGSAEHMDLGRPGAPPGHPDSYTTYDRPWANVSNTPFRQFKQWVHEGGIATPLIVRWPGVVPAGVVTDETGHVMDLMPTFLEMANARYPERLNGVELIPLQGRSLMPILRGGSRSGEEPIFWEHEGNRAVRWGRWKLVAENDGEWEVYDLENDPTELHNLAGEQPKRVAELTQLYAGWTRRANVLPWDEVQAIQQRNTGKERR